MALIKSNRLVQAGTAVVAGDQLIPGAEVPVPPPAASFSQLERTIPSAEEGAEADTTDVVAELAGVVEQAGEVVPDDTPLGALLEGFDVRRDELLAEAQAGRELALQEAMATAAEALGSHLEALEQEVREQLASSAMPSSPDELETSMEALAPQLEQAALARTQVEGQFAANSVRWEQAASSEERIAILLSGYSHQVASGGDAEQIVLNLLAEREQVLADARLRAEEQLADAEARAAAVVAEAQERAARILAEIEAKRKELLAQLEQQGYAQGYQEGRSQADEEAEKIVSEAVASLNAARDALPIAIRETQPRLLQLAVDIAEKIVERELANDPTLVGDILERAIKRVSDTERVVIKVHPDDLPLIKEQEDRFRDLLKNVRNLEFASSSKMTRGGVFIETSSGTVDATIATQLSVIQEAFKNTLSEFGGSLDAGEEA